MKRIILLKFTMIIGFCLSAQTVIPTPWTVTTSQAGITFNVQNTNATDGRLVDVTTGHATGGVACTVELWMKTSPITANPAPIAQRPGARVTRQQQDQCRHDSRRRTGDASRDLQECCSLQWSARASRVPEVRLAPRRRTG